MSLLKALSLLYAEAGSYVDLGDFSGTCISDPGNCESQSMTWSLWLKITGGMYYVSSGGQASLVRGVAFMYKSTETRFVLTVNTEQFTVIQKYLPKMIPTNEWFHLTFTVNLKVNPNEALQLFINGALVDPDAISSSELGITSDGCTKLYIGMSNTCNDIYSTNVYGGSAAYSNLMVFDSLLNQQQILSIYSGESFINY